MYRDKQVAKTKTVNNESKFWTIGDGASGQKEPTQI
ncbi:hypothetical protein BN1002_03084 [Bacillus sp. B-jedd]|nr:hypothetical protein BN1002_03084 [Bacillus sp. B-jedd]